MIPGVGTPKNTNWRNTNSPRPAETGETITWDGCIIGLVDLAEMPHFKVSDPGSMREFVDLGEI